MAVRNMPVCDICWKVGPDLNRECYEVIMYGPKLEEKLVLADLVKEGRFFYY